MREIGIRRIQSNGQVSIPREIVKSMGLEAGDPILFIEDECGVYFIKAKVGPAEGQKVPV